MIALALALVLSASTVDLVDDCGATANTSTDDDAPETLDCFLGAVDGTLTVPAGVFDLERQAGASVAHAVRLDGDVHDVEVQCEPGAVFKIKHTLTVQTGDEYVFHLIGAQRIHFQGCEFDGNRGALLVADEQTHIFLTNDAANITWSDCILRNAWGDGIKVIGTLTAGVYASHDLLVEDSLFIDNGRGGIGLASTVRKVDVLRTDFLRTSDQAIDFEPGSGYGIVDVTIEDVYIGPSTSSGVYVLTLSGGSTPSTDIKLNRVRVYGPVHSNLLEGATLNDVDITSASTCFTGSNRVRDVSIKNSDWTCGGEGIALAAYDTTASPADFSFVDNRVTLTGTSAMFLRLDGGGPGGYLVVGNDVWAPNGSIGALAYIRDTLNDSIPVANNTFVNNRVRGLKYGVMLLGSYGLVSDVLIEGLDFVSDQTGSVGIYCDSPVSNVRRHNNRIKAATPVYNCP